MTRSTNMEHVEVLRVLRERAAEWGHETENLSALDAAIAALSAPQPPAEPTNRAESSSKLVDGQPPAEAQPVAKLVNRKDADGGKTTTFIRPTSLGMDLPLGEYPLHLHPSAPVGVEGVEAALQKWLDWCNEHNEEPEAKSGARIAIEALAAQQPAACPKCGGTGEADSGGIMPWGAPAMILCECQQPAADPRSTHRVWRGDDWQPCYCEATDDHRISSEQPTAVDEAMVRKVAKAINAEMEGTDDVGGAWKRLGSNERKLRDRMARAALAAQQLAAVDEAKPIYYMRDNHTFKRLSDHVPTALTEIEAEFSAGYTYGMLCSERPGFGNVHASGSKSRVAFLAACEKSMTAALAQQPAAVDVGDIVSEYEAECEAHGDKRIAMLSALSLAAQPGGSDNG